MKKINVRGAIISNADKEAYNFFDVDSTCPNDISSQLINGEDVEIVINSGGGNVFAGAEIYSMLKEHTGQVIAKVTSIAASSASIIAMGADKVLMSPPSQMMIHNVSVKAGGDYRDMEHTAEVLKSANSSLANAYRIKTGLSEEEILDMMNKETWLSPQKAIELGFADEIMYENKINEDELELVANATNDTVTLPKAVINKYYELNNSISTPSENTQVDFLMQKKLSAQLQLLKLKGARPL